MTRMKSSGFDWRCPCGWRTGRLRTIDEVTDARTAHQLQHQARNARLMRPWNGLHLATCPYECDCPADERRPA